jgi:omega-amidase
MRQTPILGISITIMSGQSDMRIKLSIAQMNIQVGKPEANSAKVQEFAKTAAERGSTLLLLPELWSSGYDLENRSLHADVLGEGLFAWMSFLAKKFRLYIGGSLLERHNDQVYNTFVLYQPTGALAGLYRKIHLFRLMNEHLWLSAGESLALGELALPGVTNPVQAGLAICYDLRFPEMFRAYALAGAELILLPAEWPKSRSTHWKTLLRARAIENQCFLIGANCCGVSNGETFAGASAIINPWGEASIEGGENEELFTAEINLDEVYEARAKIPILTDRRPGLYTLDR